jgi:hypothetical protein
MKRNSPIRLKLHRETLGSLTSPEMAAAQGGAVGTLTGCISNYRTCGCPPPLTQTCPTICGGSCSATTQTC